MKRSFWLACVVALGIGAVQPPAAARDGRVISLRGAATLNGATLRRSSAINGGDRIETRARSRVKIVMNDGTVLDIGPDTAFKIDRFAYRKEQPSTWGSAFSLIRGALRYVSGLIARRDARNVSIGAGTATIGIRGSFDTIRFDGTTVTVDTELGEASISFPPSAAFPNGQTINIPVGRRGAVNSGTGQSSVGALPAPSPITQAARAIADSPDDPAAVTAALAGKSDAEQALVFAVLLNNTDHLGVTDRTTLARAVGHAAAANSANAALVVFVASALDPSNADAYIEQARRGAPGETSRIQRAGALGVDVEAEIPDGGPAGGVPAGNPEENGAEGGNNGADPNAENPATAESETEPGEVPSPSTQP